MNKAKLGFVVLCCMVIPGVMLGLTVALWSALVAPTLSVPVSQILDKPILEIVLAGMCLLAMPGACMFALASFIAGIRIWLD